MASGTCVRAKMPANLANDPRKPLDRVGKGPGQLDGRGQVGGEVAERRPRTARRAAWTAPRRRANRKTAVGDERADDGHGEHVGAEGRDAAVTEEQRLEGEHDGADEDHHPGSEEDRPQADAGGMRRAARDRGELERREHEAEAAGGAEKQQRRSASRRSIFLVLRTLCTTAGAAAAVPDGAVDRRQVALHDVHAQASPAAGVAPRTWRRAILCGERAAPGDAVHEADERQTGGYYPGRACDLRGRACLVVGGGARGAAQGRRPARRRRGRDRGRAGVPAHAGGRRASRLRPFADGDLDGRRARGGGQRRPRAQRPRRAPGPRARRLGQRRRRPAARAT